jgi:multidrug efflux pump subunit AcrA (membrane-fusion protein)
MSRRLAPPVLLILTLAACGGRGQVADPEATPKGVPSGTPVQVAEVRLATMDEAVYAPGRTVALVQQKIRAPFAGTLTELTVVVGDKVGRGERVGTIVARDSEAAVAGAEEMARDAGTAQARADAERALALARKDLVSSPLRSWTAGVVSDRAASAGDRVAEDQELLTVASLDSLVFVADLAQSDLAVVRPGQPVTISLTGRPRALRGLVHGLLASADAANSTAPMRIDLARPLPTLAAGLFGTARIVVRTHAKVPVVPRSAVLTDDVSGVRRLAEVIGGKAHWVEVQTGLFDEGLIEIVSPALVAGTPVIVGGQVGLPEGTAVVAGP